jgi:hypothetical protein
LSGAVRDSCLRIFNLIAASQINISPDFSGVGRA